MKPPPDPISDHAGAVNWDKPPLSQPTGMSPGLDDLQARLARVRVENDALRAKCARLAATVDELLLRLYDRWPRPGRTEPALCPECGSREVRYRTAMRCYECVGCGAAIAVGRCAPRATGTSTSQPEPTYPRCTSADGCTAGPIGGSCRTGVSDNA